jgi:hypothetical protein
MPSRLSPPLLRERSAFAADAIFTPAASAMPRMPPGDAFRRCHTIVFSSFSIASAQPIRRRCRRRQAAFAISRQPPRQPSYFADDAAAVSR